MADLIPNSFTSYNLTTEEVLQGSIYNELQLQVLHNHLSSYAEQKLALEFDPDKPKHFLQDQSSIAGKIDFINYLIEASEASLDALNETITSNE